MVAGVVYYTCLIENSPRSMGEISTISGISLKRMNRIYQLLSKESTSASPATDSKKSTPGAGYVQLLPADLIGRMASQLKLSQNLISVARECCQRIVQYDLINGCSPQVIAAGVLALIYVATKQKFKVTDLIKVSFTSEPSIKRIYHELQQDCLSIFPRHFVTSIGGITQIPLHLPDTM
jgi:transcription initiation factor TFIIIB Brf1 subunit/transcription initiation factor TFIIB